MTLQSLRESTQNFQSNFVQISYRSYTFNFKNLTDLFRVFIFVLLDFKLEKSSLVIHVTYIHWYQVINIFVEFYVQRLKVCAHVTRITATRVKGEIRTGVFFFPPEKNVYQRSK